MKSISILAIAAFVLLTFGCKKENPASLFHTDKDSYNVKQSIQFNNTSQNGLHYYWDFGDGSTSTLKNPGHTYTETGTYIITLQVEGAKKTIDSEFSKTLTIVGAQVSNPELQALFANTDWTCTNVNMKYHNCSGEIDEIVNDDTPNQSFSFKDDNSVVMLNGSTGNICQYEILNDSTIGFYEDPYYRIWIYKFEGEQLTMTRTSLSPCSTTSSMSYGEVQVKQYLRN